MTQPQQPRTAAGRAFLDAIGHGDPGLAEDYLSAIEAEAALLDAAPQETPHSEHWKQPGCPDCEPLETGLDVERLADFFHEEYWSQTGDPHWPRERADGTDCEICWKSANKLYVFLAAAPEPAHQLLTPEQARWRGREDERMIDAPSYKAMQDLVHASTCGDCDGVGWVEGGEALQTTCARCGGTGKER